MFLPAPNKRHRVSCSLSVSRVGLETHKRKREFESRRGKEEERVAEQEREVKKEMAERTL